MFCHKHQAPPETSPPPTPALQSDSQKPTRLITSMKWIPQRSQQRVFQSPDRPETTSTDWCWIKLSWAVELLVGQWEGIRPVWCSLCCGPAEGAEPISTQQEDTSEPGLLPHHRQQRNRIHMRPESYNTTRENTHTVQEAPGGGRGGMVKVYV